MSETEFNTKRSFKSKTYMDFAWMYTCPDSLVIETNWDQISQTTLSHFLSMV